MSIKEKQIQHWLNKCKYNMNYFKFNHNTLSHEEKKEFITDQYRLVSIINNVLIGRTKLVGVDTSKFKK